MDADDQQQRCSHQEHLPKELLGRHELGKDWSKPATLSGLCRGSTAWSQADVHKSLEHGWCSHGALRIVGRTMQICQVINRRCKPHMMKFYTGLRGNEGSKARRADWSRNCFWEEGGWVLSKMWEDPDNVMVIWRHWRRRATHSKNHVERTDMAPPTQDPLKSKQFTFLRFA